MEMRTIIQRENTFYLISTVDLGKGDFRYQTTIVLSSSEGYIPPAPLYRCHYKTLENAISGHRNVMELWPGAVT